MALMSSLLFVYSLVTIAPQMLGDSPEVVTPNPVQTTSVHTFHELQTKLKPSNEEQKIVSNDGICAHCKSCMAKALKTQTNITNDDVHNYKIDLIKRYRRDGKKYRKKYKNVNHTKTVKSATVIKYRADEKVFALKVKEASLIGLEKVKVCNVYGVYRSVPCGTIQANDIIAKAKKKIHDIYKAKFPTTPKPVINNYIIKKHIDYPMENWLSVEDLV